MSRTVFFSRGGKTSWQISGQSGEPSRNKSPTAVSTRKNHKRRRWWSAAGQCARPGAITFYGRPDHGGGGRASGRDPRCLVPGASDNKRAARGGHLPPVHRARPLACEHSRAASAAANEAVFRR